MAEISKIAVTLSRPVKLAPYEYAKPEIFIEATIEEGDNPSEVREKLYKLASSELAIIIEQEIAEYNS